MNLLTLADVVVDPIEEITYYTNDTMLIAIGVAVVAVVVVAVSLIVRASKKSSGKGK